MTDLDPKFTFFTFTRKHRKQLISESNPVKYIKNLPFVFVKYLYYFVLLPTGSGNSYKCTIASPLNWKLGQCTYALLRRVQNVRLISDTASEYSEGNAGAPYLKIRDGTFSAFHSRDDYNINRKFWDIDFLQRD